MKLYITIYYINILLIYNFIRYYFVTYDLFTFEVGSKFTLRLIKEKTKTYPITRGARAEASAGAITSI